MWGMTEGGRKTTGNAPEVLPRVVLYDPELTVSLPAAITGTSAMNAMAHCVEAFYAPGANPISSLMAEEAIGALGRGAPAAVERPDDLDARAELLYGAYLAGAACAIAGIGLHHRICHVLGGAYDLPHADMHTVVLPHVIAFQAPGAAEAIARVARALRADGAHAAAPAIYALNERVGAPRALREIGMREADLEEAVGLIMEQVPPDNPRPVDEDAIRALLGDAFAGRPPRSTHATRLERAR